MDNITNNPVIADIVAKQLRQLRDPIRAFVRCPDCQKKLKPEQSFRCLYCGVWFCQSCAEIHFGQSREEYFETRFNSEEHY